METDSSVMLPCLPLRSPVWQVFCWVESQRGVSPRLYGSRWAPVAVQLPSAGTGFAWMWYTAKVRYSSHGTDQAGLGIGQLTERAAFLGQSAERNREVDTLAIRARGGNEGTLKRATLLGRQFGDVGGTNGVVGNNRGVGGLRRSKRCRCKEREDGGTHYELSV